VEAVASDHNNKKHLSDGSYIWYVDH
jgi:hypothetical protein